MRKPRLTDKVLSGLSDMCSIAEAGDMQDGDYEASDLSELQAAIRWVTAMLQYRAAKKQGGDDVEGRWGFRRVERHPPG